MVCFKFSGSKDDPIKSIAEIIDETIKKAWITKEYLKNLNQKQKIL